ncbi:hypothetical protein B0H10DRAFT_2216312 [Mycena sp. CBHHK59/15]|nr:hypothetical protein B0H10DRAFT_2216312 [Mycena sp. CBHHK59/15]
MDSTDLQSEFTSEEDLTEPDDSPNSDSGAFFPHARHFVISGGHFTSNMKNVTSPAPAEPSDFRMIPLGDLDLRKEIRMEQDSGVVNRRRAVNFARRMYSARLNRLSSDMTVALYQGQNAEEDWRQDLERYSGIR